MPALARHVLPALALGSLLMASDVAARADAAAPEFASHVPASTVFRGAEPSRPYLVVVDMPHDVGRGDQHGRIDLGRRALAPVLERVAALQLAGPGEADGGPARLTEQSFPEFGIAVVDVSPRLAAQIASLPGVAHVVPDRIRRLPDSYPPNGSVVNGQTPARTASSTLSGEDPAVPSAAPTSRQTQTTAGGTSPRQPTWNLESVAAPAAWRQLGASGEGVVIATMDTGADWLHPALLPRYRGRAGDHAYNWMDFTPSAANRPYDGNGHGSHVLGLLVGRDAAADYGVAPGATWIAARVFDNQGISRDSWLLEAAAWLLAPTDLDGRNPRPDLAPDVVNASWVLENGADPLYRPVVAAWESAGIVPVFAAGNDDRGTGTEGGVLAPAAYPESLAVGATTRQGEPWYLSLTGPSPYTDLKPDLVAPGVGVVSTLPGERTGPHSGTSMAAPHVSGAAAVLLSVAELSPEDVMRLLRESARDTGAPGPDSVQGYGALNVRGAARRGADAGRLDLNVGGGPPYAPARLTGRRTPGSPVEWNLVTDEAGLARGAVPSGDWRIEVSRPGFNAHTVSLGVSPGQTSMLHVDLDRLPTARIAGRVLSWAGSPVAGARINGATLLSEGRSGPDGRFDVEATEGRAEIRVSAPGYRQAHVSTHTDSHESSELDLELVPAPRLLVVDADAASEERIYPYLTRHLETAGIPFDVWSPADVSELRGGLVAERLSNFEAAIWIHRLLSPGRLEAIGGADGLTAALEEWVMAGGRLLIAGQNIGMFDAAEGPHRLAPEFYRRLLGARRLEGQPAHQRVVGRDTLEGIDLDLRSSRGLPRARVEPDVLAPLGPETSAVATYPDGTVAGVLGQRGKGRILYLGFALESAGPPKRVARLLETSIGTLFPARSADLSPTRLAVTPSRLRGPSPVTATLVISNAAPGTPTDAGITVVYPRAFEASELGPSASGGSVQVLPRGFHWRADPGVGFPVTVTTTGVLRADSGVHDFTASIASGGEATPVDPAQVLTAGPELQLLAHTAAPAALEAGGTVTMSLRLKNEGALSAQGEAACSVPAPLIGKGAQTNGSARWVTSTLQVAPAEVWSWDITLAAPSGTRESSVVVSCELDDGFAPSKPVSTDLVIPLMGPDLGGSSFAFEPPTAGPADRVRGLLRLRNGGSLTGDVRAEIGFPPLLSVVPGSVSASAGETQTGPASVQWTVTLAGGGVAELELDAQVARSVAPNSRIVVPVRLEMGQDHLTVEGELLAHPLELSARLQSDKTVEHPGSEVRFDVDIDVLTGTVTSGALELLVPPGLDVTASGDFTEEGGDRLVWRAPWTGDPKRLSWRGRLSDQLEPGALVTVRAAASVNGLQAERSQTSIRVVGRGAPLDGSGNRWGSPGSALKVSPPVARQGAAVEFVLRVANGGEDRATFVVTDPLPAGLDFVPGSLQASYGVPAMDAERRVVTWSGALEANTAAEVRFTALFQSAAPVTNRMTVSSAHGEEAHSVRVVPLRMQSFLPASHVHND